MQVRTLCVAALLPLSVACTRGHAKTAPDSPGLEMPAPPSHDVTPIEAEPLTSTPVTADPDDARRTTTPRPRTTPPPVRETAKPDPPKPEPAKPEAPEPPKVEEPRPSPPLQTTPANAEGEAERSIRATLSHASGDLSHVDYRTLNADGRSQYDQAKRFMKQAEDAIREKNLVFARSVADKAATIAAQLARR